MSGSANILLCPVGSAGDVYPYVGLGDALQRRGHKVTLLTSGYFRETAERVGLEFVDILPNEDFLRLAGDPLLWHPLYGVKTILKSCTGELIRLGYQAIADRFEPGNTVVASSCLGFGARLAHERLNVPLVTIDLQPAALWSDYETPKLFGFSQKSPTWVKKFQYWIGERFFLDPYIMPQLNSVRAELGLTPIGKITSWWHSPQCILALFPEWYAAFQPDWPPHLQLTNFPLWNEQEDEALPTSVEDFLSAGEPPIAFTPGSGNMFGREFFQAAAEACAMLGMRGMLFSRFHDHLPAPLPNGVQHFDYAPFRQVLPHCAAISHHGGIGTTAQALEAGIPQLIMPLSFDQPDNAHRVQRLGVGDWLSPKTFRGPAVAKKLRELLGQPAVQRSCELVRRHFDLVDDPYAGPCETIESLIGKEFDSQRQDHD